MSGIVLSASVRQNLLSLQSTADLLATTQSRLSTGKKVNTALDNPTNFFTAQSLDGRASDINNLLDSIGNGVQVLQAANAGITSLSKLVDTAKSVANQVLQTTVGYSTKSNLSATVAGATALDLPGTTTFTSATAFSNGNSLIYIGASATTSTATVGDVLRAIDIASGVRISTVASGGATTATNSGQTVSSVGGSGAVSLQTSTGGDLSVSGKADFL